MIETLINTIIGLFLFDIGVMSNIWMYIPLLIPISCYLIFFLIKWAILTAPIWLPIVIIVSKLKD